MSTRLGFRLSNAIKKTVSPPIPIAKNWAATYKPTKIRPLLDLSQGVPGTPPPVELLNALAEAARDPANCGYGPTNGELPLRQALVDEMKYAYGESSDLAAEDVIITAGCNMAFIAAILAIASAGDEVILPVPWYFNHQMSLEMLSMKWVPLQTNSRDGFIPNVTDCESLITDKTRAIALVTPNNPTGAIYSPDLLWKFAQLARSRNIALIVDETYRDFLIDAKAHELFTPNPNADWDWRGTFIHLFSFSKSYGLPGHRLGAIIADPEVVKHVRTVLDNMQVCPPKPPQVALPPLLPCLRPFIQETSRAVNARHKLFSAAIPNFWKIISQGGYYAWVQHPYTGVDSERVSQHLACDFGIVTLPSAFFGIGPYEEGNDCIRFSVANVTDEKIEMLGKRLEDIDADLRMRLLR